MRCTECGEGKGLVIPAKQRNLPWRASGWGRPARAKHLFRFMGALLVPFATLCASQFSRTPAVRRQLSYEHAVGHLQGGKKRCRVHASVSCTSPPRHRVAHAIHHVYLLASS